MKYNLIDENGRLEYKEMSLDQIRVLAEANNYIILYSDSKPYSIGLGNMCGISKKIYSIVPVVEDNDEQIKSPMPSIRVFNDICAELSDLYARKNQDYGDSFHKTFEEYGPMMAAIRLEDKLNRFKRLIKNETAVKDESIIDTLKDLANYAIMTLMELSGDEPKGDESSKEEVPQQDPSTRYNILDAISRKIIWKRYAMDDIQYMAKNRGWVVTYNANNEPVNIYDGAYCAENFLYTVEVSTEDD